MGSWGRLFSEGVFLFFSFLSFFFFFWFLSSLTHGEALGNGEEGCATVFEITMDSFT